MVGITTKPEAKNRAKEILKLYNPSNIYPVDLDFIAKEAGLAVFRADFSEAKNVPEDAAGVIFYKNREIIINSKDRPTRQRFTLAHEFGHWFLGHGEGKDFLVDVIVDYRTNEFGKPVEEIAADIFAAELLMPEEEVSAYHKSLLVPFLSWICNKFNVSKQAMQTRLTYLKLPYENL